MTTTITKIKGQKSSTDEFTLACSGQHARIAELAYLKAEKRGFETGHEQEDWFDAERECLI
jgi:Protein of unknown function (DUF2934)